jgi:hypothetical protein
MFRGTRRFIAFAAPGPVKASLKRSPLTWLLEQTRKGEFGTAVIDVDPELAKRMLAYNAKNRNLSQKTVEAYARDMVSGDWLMTGDPVRFDVKGNLIDGQHRLQAIAETGLTFKLLIVYGLEEKARYALDMGRKRNPGDMLALMGHTRVTRLGSAARWLLTMKHGRRGHRMTAFEIIHMVEKHPKLPASVEAFDKAHPLSPSMLAAVQFSGAC